jgi:hypothetical protein
LRFANPGASGLAAINGALDRMVPAFARELAPLHVNAAIVSRRRVIRRTREDSVLPSPRAAIAVIQRMAL